MLYKDMLVYTAKYRRERADIWRRFTKRESSAIALHGDLQVTALCKKHQAPVCKIFHRRGSGWRKHTAGLLQHYKNTHSCRGYQYNTDATCM